MPDYRRMRQAGGYYFITVNLSKRQSNNSLIQHIDKLRDAVRYVKEKWPFIIHGWVVLPDHFHCLIQLPESDSDFSMRIRMSRRGFRLLYLMERKGL